MNYWTQTARNDERKEDKPPYSRIFVVCNKHLREEDLKTPFEKHGIIEDLYMPKDRNTGESKGVAYIKYSKTTSAAAAIQELHMKVIGNSNKPVKVMVANSKHDNNNTNEDRYKRLFIKVHKQATEMEIRKHFSTFGHLESVHLQRDKVTEENKGFAYVQFKTFLDAARAFEECDRKYKPVFATPKDELKRSRNSLECQIQHASQINANIGPDSFFTEQNNPLKEIMPKRDSLNSLLIVKPQNYNTVNVTCSPQVPQKFIERLFNIVPGMVQCQYTIDSYNGFCKAVINYEDDTAAAHAVERLNNFEFPSGEIVSVKPDINPITKAAHNLTNIVNNFKNAIYNGAPDLVQLADAIAHASTIIKEATSGQVEHRVEQEKGYCSVNLPPPQPILNRDTRVAQRCFIVCKPQPPPIAALRDVFCRFGDLIDVSTFPNKTFGFAKYASITAAQDAIKTLNGAILCGVKLKVLEADEKPFKDDQKLDEDMESNDICADHNDDRKRIKLDDKDTHA